MAGPTVRRTEAGFLSTARLCAGSAGVATVRSVMLAMFLLWIVVFIGVFAHWRWTPGIALAALGWTLVLLRLHMSSTLPLNF